MADVATPSGAPMFDGGAQEKKKGIEKPEKPDEDTYKAALKKAEKEHAVSMEKFVSAIFILITIDHLVRNGVGSLLQVGARHPATCSHTY
jgi:hypothetical protein